MSILHECSNYQKCHTPWNHGPSTSTLLEGWILTSCNSRTLRLLSTTVSTLQSTVSTSHLVMDQELPDQVWRDKGIWTHISCKEKVVGCTEHQRLANKIMVRSLNWMDQSYLSPTRSEHFLHHWHSLHQSCRAPPSTWYSGSCYMGTVQSLTTKKHGPKKLWSCPSTHMCSSPPYPNHYTSNHGLHSFLRLHNKGKRLVSLLFTLYLGSTSIGNNRS
jgi:hypothetical protein